MKIFFINLPWTVPGRPDLWGVRAGSRWPHFQNIQPGSKLPAYLPFPFFMASSASVANDSGHEVKLLDAVAEGMMLEDVFEKVVDFSPDMIFAETSTPSLNSDISALKHIKEFSPSSLIVCGGSHSPSFALEMMKKENFPDFWIAGEYDYAVSELACALEKKTPLENVQGVLSAESPDVPEFSKVEELDLLPAPLFDQLPVINYSDPVCGLPSPGAQSWLSRGCPFKCSFCVWPQVIYGSREYRIRNIEKALDEVEALINDYGCESFYFDDDTANIGEDRMKELASSIKKRKLDKYPWSMMARADCMTPGMIEVLADAGLYSIKYGVESISPSLLNACEKATDAAKFFNAIEKTREAGVKMHLTFTFGIPGETSQSIRETVDFAIKTAPESAQFSICTPFPGTRFYDDCVKKGYLLSADWSRFLGSGEDVVISTPELPAEELSREYQNALKRWNSFTASRMRKREERLLSRIRSKIDSGMKWFFMGDKDFASFIFSEENITSNLENKGNSNFTVIVSRHDEEKIFRRIIREGGRPESILRLYSGND